MICLSLWFITLCLWLYCISITKMSDMSITVIYHAMSLTTVLVSLRWVICLSLIYHVMSLTTVSVSLRWVICLSLWFIMVCLWLYCISITKMSDISITVIYHGMSRTVSVSLRRVIRLSITVIYHGMSLTVLYQYHKDEWYVYHNDLSWYVSDCTVSVSLRWVIRLSQWFITVCLWLYCISITKMSDMSLTVLYQYH